MANTYHQVYVQIIFAVKYRKAVLNVEWRSEVFAVIARFIENSGCQSLIVNGVDDHVHCFLSLKPTVCISELMKSVKAKSSKFINDRNFLNHHFEWQEGYGAFSYSQSQIQKVYSYIENQEKHHLKKTFREEYLELLEKFEIEFDERYLFDDLV